jgi:hypothetical protein
MDEYSARAFFADSVFNAAGQCDEAYVERQRALHTNAFMKAIIHFQAAVFQDDRDVGLDRS